MPRRKAKTARAAREQPYLPPTPQWTLGVSDRRGAKVKPLDETHNVTHISAGALSNTEGALQSESKTQTALPNPQHDAAKPRLHVKGPFSRRGTFHFLALPLEIRQMIYHLLLIPIGDKLVTLHFGQFMPGLGGPSYNQNILRVCRFIRQEALDLLYSGTVYIRGFDLMDFSSFLRLSQHPWLRNEILPIKRLKVRLSLLAREADFEGRSEVFLQTLPECRNVTIELSGEQDWQNARGKTFLNFVSSLKLEGVEVELSGFERSRPCESNEKGQFLLKSV